MIAAGRTQKGARMAEKLGWGIIGTGRIAGIFARGLAAAKWSALVAVASRTREAAERFGAEFDTPHRHAGYDALLADSTVQAVYIATPHPMHAEWAIKAAEAGKHILCEKPLALNHAEAMAVIEAARRHSVFLMEAFFYRCQPQTARVLDFIHSGAIGDVRVIQATYSFQTAFAPERRLFRDDLGGGAILDVGCYPVSFARLIAGAAIGQPFADPEEVKGTAHLGETGVDEYAVAALRFPGDVLAEIATGIRVQQENVVRIFGTEGQIVIPEPFLPSRAGTPTSIFVHRRGADPEEVIVSPTIDPYGFQADYCAEQIAAGNLSPPAVSWEDTLGNMRALDLWRDSIGLTFAREKPAAGVLTVHRRPLARRSDAPMMYGEIAGVGKSISRLVMGTDNQRTMPHAAVMFDDFFERGGTAFDTAWQYVGGRSERLLGQWIADRGVREQLVILDKGAHTPLCTPEHCHRQLLESLDRLQTDYVDIYMLHRDNADVPGGEFIDVLDAHVRAGRVRVFGASNWSLARIEEANVYAAAHGKTGFTVVSNNFSLARMVEPPWAGCLSVADAESRAWFARTQMPLLPWSSQARGFFTDRARPEGSDDPELVRCWYSADNWHRRTRAVELAKDRHVLPINIALAYVLCQPFPTFPLIGPRTLEETRTSLAALDVTLTPDEVRWLNLEA
jgi:predicted dehydrogenase/aryl-alcohol dehydrogenase-like predicted oxidoreductase